MRLKPSRDAIRYAIADGKTGDKKALIANIVIISKLRISPKIVYFGQK
ncbi:hypothetical protein HMPREF1870_01045 [Bacteroidales bacterium KA00344]|nr:hypothetical protein HMPREF1870_01045 [Bacteroidales bacterium KA00344]